jgi:hypothetical protein
MSEFRKFDHLYYYGSKISVDSKNGSIFMSASVRVQAHHDECTREEFCEAAKKAISIIKENTGIDLGTDWLPKWKPKPGELVYCWGIGSTILNVGIYQGAENDALWPHRVNYMKWTFVAPFSEGIPEPFKSQWEEAAK